MTRSHARLRSPTDRPDRHFRRLCGVLVSDYGDRGGQFVLLFRDAALLIIQVAPQVADEFDIRDGVLVGFSIVQHMSVDVAVDHLVVLRSRMRSTKTCPYLEHNRLSTVA